MIVYVDVIFLENLILDSIILLATGIICNRKISVFKIAVASIIGSLYTIFSWFIKKDFIIFKIIISLILVLISFGFDSRKSFLKNLGVFYLTSITFGGSAFLLMFSINPEKLKFSSGHFLGFYPIKIAIVRWNIRLFLNYYSSKKSFKKILKIMWYRNFL